MDSKTRVKAALNHELTGRLPAALEATSEVMEVLLKHFDIQKEVKEGEAQLGSFQSAAFGIDQENEVRRRLGADVVIVATPTSERTVGNWFGLPLVKRLPDGRIEGGWGIKFREFEYPYGTYIEIDSSPLASAESYGELEAHPSPGMELFDFGGLAEILPKYQDFYVLLNVNGPFDIARYMRGTEQFLMDLALEPRKAEVLLDKVTEFAMEYMDRCMEQAAGLAEGVFCGDDFGSQVGMVMSPAMWRKYVKPRYKTLIERIKGHGLVYVHHSCGGVRPIIPDLIELGVDVLNPIQPLAAGMDPAELGEEYGRDLCFYGGIDEQQTLPYGTPADVRRETRHRIETLGKYGGYIVAPSHAFQPDTPLENILAMYEEVNKM
jgi:uroporphyrinogen decarboxylase